MEYVRPSDPDKAVDAGFPGFRAQILSHLESALMMSSHIKEGGCGPGLHYHRSDQLYYLIEGLMNIQLAKYTTSARKRSCSSLPDWRTATGMRVPGTRPISR
jgi:hypothetical protein